MPAILAHFQFGTEVLKGLSGEELDIISKFKDEYTLGLQGPDVLFFYKPYTGTYISKTGSLIHSKAGRFFFEKGKMSCDKYKDESVIAYLFGCVCHFCLDKNAHPYINEHASVSMEHHRIEAELDLFVSKKHGLRYPRNTYLPLRLSNYEALGSIYNVSGRQFKNSLADMRRYSKLLENRKLIEGAEKLVRQKGVFSCMSVPEKLVYERETAKIYDIMRESVEECRRMISELYKYIKGNLTELLSFGSDFEGEKYEND